MASTALAEISRLDSHRSSQGRSVGFGCGGKPGSSSPSRCHETCTDRPDTPTSSSFAEYLTNSEVFSHLQASSSIATAHDQSKTTPLAVSSIASKAQSAVSNPVDRSVIDALERSSSHGYFPDPSNHPPSPSVPSRSSNHAYESKHDLDQGAFPLSSYESSNSFSSALSPPSPSAVNLAETESGLSSSPSLDLLVEIRQACSCSDLAEMASVNHDPNQTDISRTPSTSTTSSSHSSSLNTSISSVQSSAVQDSHSHPCADQSSDTLKAASHLTPHPSRHGQESSIPFQSESDAVQPSSHPGAASAERDDVPAETDKQTQAKVRRYAALLELVDTERNYADDLATLVLVFFDNLYMMPFFDEYPARQALVMRNAQDLLRLHQKMSAKMEAILNQLGLRKPSSASLSPSPSASSSASSSASASSAHSSQFVDLEKATSAAADEAVIRIARLFTSMMPSLHCYQKFCSRHGEALALIREAEKRQTDWDCYEKKCAEILKASWSASLASTSRPPSGTTTFSSSSPSSNPTTPATFSTPIQPLTAITSTAAQVHSLMRQNSSRLLFRDFLIKPIQRLCLYPLVLHTLLKYTPASSPYFDELNATISLMRQVADQVDQAGRKRELELMAELIGSRVEPHHGVTAAFLGSLGDCQLAGTLDVLHHHRILDPLVAPLRFKYYGVFLYQGFLLMVKVRKSSSYECRQWFPLWAARLSNVEEGSSLLPHSFRLSIKDHHFELAASTSKERQLWIELLGTAISNASVSPPGTEAAFPSSLFLGDSFDSDSTAASESTTPSASRRSEPQGYFDEAKDKPTDPLMQFFALHAAGSVQTTASAQKSQRSGSSPWMPTEILLRHASPSSRGTVDRGMVFSDAVHNARLPKQAGALSTFWLPNNNSTLGSTVSSAMGISRLSAKETSTVKIQRRKSCAGLLENAKRDGDDKQVIFTATLVQSSSRSKPSTKQPTEASGDKETWKKSLRKKAAKVRPSSIFTPSGLTLNTEDLPIHSFARSSFSTPASPIVSSRELATMEFVPPLAVSPTRSNKSGAAEDMGGVSLKMFPRSNSGSASNLASESLTNLKPAPAQSRRHSGVYSFKDSLTASFSRRSRTKSTQTENTDASSELAVSLRASPMGSSVALPHGAVMDDMTRPSLEELITESCTRPRSGSKSSVAGSLRRAFTLSSSSFGTRKRTQSDIARLSDNCLLLDDAMRFDSSIPMVAEPVSLCSSGSLADEQKQGLYKGGGRAENHNLRRSKTMLGSSRGWFQQTVVNTGTDQVYVYTKASACKPVSTCEDGLLSDCFANGSNMLSPEKPLSNSPTAIQVERVGSGARPEFVTRLSPGTKSSKVDGVLRESVPRSNSSDCAKRSSKMLNTFKFLQSNRLSPLPLKAVAENSVEQHKSGFSSGFRSRPGIPARFSIKEVKTRSKTSQ